MDEKTLDDLVAVKMKRKHRNQLMSLKYEMDYDTIGELVEELIRYYRSGGAFVGKRESKRC